MDKQIAFNSYKNSIKWLSYFSMAPTSVLIDTHHYNLYRLALIKHANEQAQAAFKEFRIKRELRKPFLQKLYEMFGRGLVTCRSSYFSQ